MTYLTQTKADRDPRGLAMTIGIHGAMAAAILLYPAMQVIRHEPGVVTAVNIKERPAPPLDDPEKKLVEKQQSVVTKPDSVIDMPKTPDVISDPLPPIYDYGDFTTTAGGHGIEAGGLDPIILPPVTPTIVRATRDPRFTRNFQPDYPSGLIRQELEGMVKVRVLVGTDGRVKKVEAIDFDHPDFLRATERQALKAWRFVPETRDGVPVESWITQTVRFTLNN